MIKGKASEIEHGNSGTSEERQSTPTTVAIGLSQSRESRV